VRWTTPALVDPARGARATRAHSRTRRTPHGPLLCTASSTLLVRASLAMRVRQCGPRGARGKRAARAGAGWRGDPDTLAHPPHAACVPNAYPLVHTPRPRPPPPPRANEETVACTPSPAVCSVTAHMQRRRPRGPGRRTPKSCSPRQTRGSFASGAPGARMRDTRHPRVPRHAPLRGCDRLSVCVCGSGGAADNCPTTTADSARGASAAVGARAELYPTREESPMPTAHTTAAADLLRALGATVGPGHGRKLRPCASTA